MVNTGKTIKKALACILSVVMLLSMAVMSASAEEINIIDSTVLNELSARNAVSTYFDQRFSFLTFNGENIDGYQITVGGQAREASYVPRANENITVAKMIKGN